MQGQSAAVSVSDELFAEFRQTGAKLPPELRDRILASGAAGVSALIGVLDDDELALQDSIGQGWPPIHAVNLLAEMRAVEAIEPLLRVFQRASWDDILRDRVLMRLPELGAAVLEPVLRTMADGVDPEDRHALCSVLSELGVRDERIYAALCELTREDPCFGAVCFGEYGDARALPLLEQAIETFAPDDPDSLGLTGLADLVEAHQRLGGELPESLRARVAQIRAEWQLRRLARKAQSHVAPSSKIGRNEPCPCGSGKKYKKCCLVGAPQ